jgi:hypothetical protein
MYIKLPVASKVQLGCEILDPYDEVSFCCCSVQTKKAVYTISSGYLPQ